MEGGTTNMYLPIIPVNPNITEADDHHILSISSPQSDTNHEFRFQRWRFYSAIVKSRLHINICLYAIMSSDSLSSGFDMLDMEGFSKSISPVIMSFFKYSFATANCTSSTWAFIFRSSFKTRYLFLPILVLATHFLTPFAEKWNVLLYGALDLIWTAHEKDLIKSLEVLLYWMAQFRVYESGDRMDISPDLVIVISIFSAAIWTAISDFEHLLTSSSKVSFLEETIKKLLPLAVPRVINLFEILKEKKTMGMIIKYAVGLVGSVLFQTFFKLTKFYQVQALFNLAYSWLLNLLLISSMNDLGVLNFLMVNTAGCAASLYGLGYVTWLSCWACLCVYMVQNPLKQMDLYNLPERRRENQSVLMTLFSDLMMPYALLYNFIWGMLKTWLNF